jgi:transcription initiation factor TFIIIB Brf1 subunit/transcription initiation factor TFIIB
MSETDSDDLESCKHTQTVNLDGVNICELCGKQIAEYLLEEQYYTNNNTISRHTLRKDTSRSLYSYLSAKGFPQNIIERANHYYTRIIENSIYRSKNRISIIFVSALRAYEDFGEPINSAELAKKFGLNKKGVSKGLLMFGSVFKNELKRHHVQVKDLLPKLLSDLGIQDQKLYLHDLLLIYNHAAAKSTDIRKGLPRSISVSVLFTYLRLKNHPISRETYAKIVQLTEVTFIRVAEEISRCLNISVNLE